MLSRTMLRTGSPGPVRSKETRVSLLSTEYFLPFSATQRIQTHLSLLVSSQLKVLAPLNCQHPLGPAVGLHTLQPQHNLLGGLGLGEEQSVSMNIPKQTNCCSQGELVPCPPEHSVCSQSLERDYKHRVPPVKTRRHFKDEYRSEVDLYLHKKGTGKSIQWGRAGSCRDQLCWRSLFQ